MRRLAIGLLVSMTLLSMTLLGGCGKDDAEKAVATKAAPKVKRKRVRPQDQDKPGEKADEAAKAEGEAAKDEAEKAAPGTDEAKAAPGADEAKTGAAANDEAAKDEAPAAEAAKPGEAAPVVAADEAAKPAEAAENPAEAAVAAAAEPAKAEAPAVEPAADPAAKADEAAVPAEDPAAAEADARKAAEEAARKAAEEAAKQAAEAAPPAAPEVATPTPSLRGESAPVEPALDITGFLSLADLEHVVGKKIRFRRGDLPGISPNKSYNVLYYEPQKGDDFGVSVQVWRDLNLIDSRTRYNTLKNTATNVVATSTVGDQGFRSYFGKVVTLTFADARQPLVASVSCSTRFCKAKELIELARRVAERMR